MCSRRELANAIRILSIDAIEKAQSGHPGAPMGMADIAEVLWRDFIKHNPLNPDWVNRDRFILSNGHASMLLYSILYLTGYSISLTELKNFRQLNSMTPGHPEIGSTPGIEVTTGPLGQGLANAVGISLSEKILSSRFNRVNYNIVDHYTWVFVGDGCLMEGISHEVCSLAGLLKLGKLIVFYDNNGISIDGKISEWCQDDVVKRFDAYNWHVISDINGHDHNSITHAINQAKKVQDKPSIIICNTIIGFGSPNKSGQASVHGAPLGHIEVLLTKKELRWKSNTFEIPNKIYAQWDAKEKGKKSEKLWNIKLLKYRENYPDLYKKYKSCINRDMPHNWDEVMDNFIKKLQSYPKSIATRQASLNVLEILGPLCPQLIGGSADLTPSNLTMWSKAKSIMKDIKGNYIHYGIREFGMTAIANGIAHHLGLIPYTSTFLMFMEYARNAVRMAALMGTKHILVYTHDSIGLGEDGPTHQPIEQLSTLRLIPNLSVWRPGDQVETAISWKYALERKTGPTALVLSRQNVPQFSRTHEQLKYVSYGGYILVDNSHKNNLDIIFISTGSELQLAVEVSHELNNMGYFTRVVSMPSNDVFDMQDISYRQFVLPSNITKRVAIEAGISDFWYKYIGLDGLIFGMESFGESAPSKDLFVKFGFNITNILNKTIQYLKTK